MLSKLWSRAFRGDSDLSSASCGRPAKRCCGSLSAVTVGSAELKTLNQLRSTASLGFGFLEVPCALLQSPDGPTFGQAVFRAPGVAVVSQCKSGQETVTSMHPDSTKPATFIKAFSQAGRQWMLNAKWMACLRSHVMRHHDIAFQCTPARPVHPFADSICHICHPEADMMQAPRESMAEMMMLRDPGQSLQSLGAYQDFLTTQACLRSPTRKWPSPFAKPLRMNRKVTESNISESLNRGAA